jgi:hypothetical protein
MILDNTNIFSDGQAITATANSTNVIDLGAPGTPQGAPTALVADIAAGTDIYVATNVTQAFNNLTSLKIALVSDDNTSLSSPKEIASRTYVLADINATKQLKFPARIAMGADERYLGLVYTVAGTAPTTGKVTSAIVAGRQGPSF